MLEHSMVIKDLVKAYKQVDVLKGISFTVHSGSVFCLLGSNGAGKTTTVRILATLLQADGGAASICGYDVAQEARKVRECISLTGQYAAVDEMLTARENLDMIGRLFHVTNPKARAVELLEVFRLTDAADRRVSTFSGGMRRRLDIAMSLVSAPKVLFLDEPTTGLDPQSRLEMWDIVRKLTKTGVTVFLTTQYLDEAEALADRIAVLHGGRIIANGTLDELKAAFAAGTILLGFHDAEAYQMAQNKLCGYEHVATPEARTISIPTNGSVATLSQVLQALDGISVTNLEQKQASLEDIFLKLVSQKGK